MKMILIALMILFTVPALSYALYGGETVSYNFTSCSFLTINITNASLGEWDASPNCTEETAGNFYCNCSDDWAVHLTPAINAVGNYTITITNGYSMESQEVAVSSGGGGGFPSGCKRENYVCTQAQKCCEGLNCVEGTCRSEEKIVSTTTTSTTTTTTTTTATTTTIPQEEKPKEGFPLWVYLLTGAGTIGLSLGLYEFWWKKRKKIHSPTSK